MASERDVLAARSRKAQGLGRSRPVESVRSRILIVCEGSKTEPYYFEDARVAYRLSSADVEVCGKECGSAPISVVKYAIERFSESGNKYDSVYCVFDRDSHDSYDQALALVCKHSKYGFHAISSIPSFEFWLLLHFNCSRKGYVRRGTKSPGDVVVGDLDELFRKHLGRPYCKGESGVFRLLENMLSTAVKHAERCLSDVAATGDPNPSTSIHELINRLRCSAIPPLPSL